MDVMMLVEWTINRVTQAFGVVAITFILYANYSAWQTGELTVEMAISSLILVPIDAWVIWASERNIREIKEGA